MKKKRKKHSLSHLRYVPSEPCDKPVLSLIGADGNAFYLLGKAQQVARKAGWSEHKVTKFMLEAKAGDYDHLLRTLMKYFEVE